MIKLMTMDELEKRNDLLPKDKEIVEECIREYGGYHQEDPPDSLLKQAIRGYLVRLLDENIVNDTLRKELSSVAASFAEGWEAAMNQKTVQGAGG